MDLTDLEVERLCRDAIAAEPAAVNLVRAGKMGSPYFWHHILRAISRAPSRDERERINATLARLLRQEHGCR